MDFTSSAYTAGPRFLHAAGWDPAACTPPTWDPFDSIHDTRVVNRLSRYSIRDTSPEDGSDNSRYDKRYELGRIVVTLGRAVVTWFGIG